MASARPPVECLLHGPRGRATLSPARIGYTSAREIVAACAEAGIPCLLGSNIETSPGTAAWANFFAAADNMKYAVEIIGPTMYADDLVTEPLLPQAGYLHLPKGPGMGVEIDLEKLEKYRAVY